jgi:hypothetical protein
MTVTRSTIAGNVADGTSGSGGGILNDEGSLDVSGTTIRSNTAARAGGGIEANVGSTDLVDVNLFRNSTGPNPGNGGGLHLSGAGTVTVDASRVTSNSAAKEGGGLWNSAPGSMIVTDTTFGNNKAVVIGNEGNGQQVFWQLPATGVFTIDGSPVAPG